MRQEGKTMILGDQLNNLLKIIDVMNHTIPAEETCSIFTESCRNMFACSCVAVIMLDETTEELYIRGSRGISYTFTKEFKRSIGKDIVAEVIRAQQPILINEIGPDSPYYDDLKLEQDMQSCILAPIAYEQNAAGYLYACHPEKNHFLPTDRTLFSILGNVVGLAIHKERLIHLTRKLATMDEKAHIFTYSYFRERVEYELIRAREQKYPVSLMLFDIDHYKTYREVHGEKAGEELFRTIVDIIRNELTAIDLIGRHGLDEIIICKPNTDFDKTHSCAKRILEKVSLYDFGSGVTVTLSGGIVITNQHEPVLVDLFQEVRVAMLKAQRAGRNKFCVAGE